jgi:hypothetical protein
MTKMAAVSMYFGGINSHGFKEAFDQDLKVVFPKEVAFLKRTGLMTEVEDGILLTEAGKACLGGCVSLFYSPLMKKYVCVSYASFSTVYHLHLSVFLSYRHMHAFTRT